MLKAAVDEIPVSNSLAQSTLFFFCCSATDTHAIAEANRQKNENLRAAFGLNKYFVDGSSLDPNRKAKQEEARALEMAQKNYA
jgi:hypothetical protein